MSCIRTHGMKHIVHMCNTRHDCSPGCLVSLYCRDDYVGTIISISDDFDDEVMKNDVTVLWDVAPYALTAQERAQRDFMISEDREIMRILKDQDRS